MLTKAAKQAGIEWVSFHAFRHTCASVMLDAGKNIRQVSGWLGHADPAFTLRTYCHLIDEGLGDAVTREAWGNGGATQHPGPAANETPRTTLKQAV